MTTPLWQYPSISAAARAIGRPVQTVWLRKRAVEAKGLAFTRERFFALDEPVRIIKPKPKAPGGRVPILGCESIALAARAYGMTLSALHERIQSARREDRPLTKRVLIDAYGTGHGQRKQGRPKSLSVRSERQWARVETECGRLLERALKRAA